MASNTVSTKIIIDILDDMLLAAGNKTFVTYKDVLNNITGEDGDYTVKDHEYYNKLINARKKIEKTLESRGMKFVYANGKDCGDGFRYPDGANNPMREERSGVKKMRTKQVERLLRASAGLFPPSWLADILSYSRGMYDDGEPIIMFGENMRLNRIELLPVFYNAIENQKVLRFNYCPGFGKKSEALLFHAYRIKEYNQRWFVFGQSQSVTGSGRNMKYNICALDRIVGKVTEEDYPYLKPQKEAYGAKYFKDIIGVSHYGKEVLHITIECQDDETCARIQTKPLHESQLFMKGDEKKTFTIDVIPNKELYTLLLSFGDSIKVLSPKPVVEEMKKRVEKLSMLYR